MPYTKKHVIAKDEMVCMLHLGYTCIQGEEDINIGHEFN